MATDPTYVDYSALYSKADTTSTGRDDERNVVPTNRGTRSFFIIDKSKMAAETDTVEGAKVVYIPENEFEKPLYQSRCSCLIGVADAYRNFTGTLPQFFTMSGASYACKLLEPNYFMFLLGRLYEPGERVLHSLQLIYDIFHFYYHSPGAVMTKSLGDWETFTTNMKFIFSKINEFVFRDTHSISFMFPTLPYSQSAVKKRRSRYFMSASRILRSCQQHKSIIGGCIMHNTEILCNQLSPELMAKLQVVGGQGIELNTKSILAENVAPETVWVLEVYLTPEEVESLQNVKKDLELYRTVYHNMTPNSSLLNNPCTVPSRFQSPSSRSSSKAGKRTTKLSSWRSHTTPRVANTASIDDDDYYNLPPITDTRANHADSSSETDRQGLQSLRSDDSALFKPDTSTVSIFSRKSWKTPRSTQSRGRGNVEAASGSKDTGERERQGRDRTTSSRTMPKLHSKVEQRHIQYDDPDEFLDTPSLGVSHSAHQTQGSMTTPLNKDSSDYSDLPPFPIAPTSQPNEASSDYSDLPSFPITSTAQPNEAPPDYSNLPSLPTAPISLNIPIAGGKQTEASSPLLSVGGSSVEEERFTTPSPNFPSLLTPQPSTMDTSPKLEFSSCVDQSNSFQTVTKSSQPSSKQQSPTYNTNAYESSTIPPLQPPKVVTSTPISHSLQKAPVEEDDFVEADVLDQLIAESRLRRQLKAVQVSKEMSSDAGDGVAEVTEDEVDKRNRPLPALPSEDDDAPTGSDVEQLPPPLPPRGQSQDTTDENQQLNTSPPEFKIQTDPYGESGEFSVTPLSLALPAKQPSTEHRVENNFTESTSPPSPQKKHSEGEEWVSEQCIPDKKPSETQVEEENPPTASPGENLDLLTVEGNSKDPLDRSRSSSPDHQHRGLTQLGTREPADGPGELEDMQGEEEIPEEFPRKKCPSTSVDPREEGEISNEEGTADEVTGRTYPAPVLITSDEEESGEESTVDISKTSTLLHSHPPLSKGDLDGVFNDSGSVFDSVPRAHLMGTPESGNMSLNQLFTPETTLQISAVQDLQNPRVTVTDTSSVVTDTSIVAVGSDMGMPRPRVTSRIHTLGRQLQPPGVAPTPQLETYCLYVQRQFNTTVVLVAKKGLHKDHSLLTKMWKGLAQQLFALDQGFQSAEEQDKEHARSPSILAVYQNTDQFCAAEIQKAPYKFRHAIRCMHLEYQKDPDLCQVTLILNGSCKMVSQKVMKRETFFDYYKSQASDVFSTAAQTTRGARQNSHRLIAGGTPAQFL